MALYEFVCNECQGAFDALASYDETESYPSVECPNCQSKNKRKIPSLPAYPVGTRDRLERFDYRAGANMSRAQGERRAAEAMSHMGQDPYKASGWDDTSLGEGITDVERETFTL